MASSRFSMALHQLRLASGPQALKHASMRWGYAFDLDTRSINNCWALCQLSSSRESSVSVRPSGLLSASKLLDAPKDPMGVGVKYKVATTSQAVPAAKEKPSAPAQSADTQNKPTGKEKQLLELSDQLFQAQRLLASSMARSGVVDARTLLNRIEEEYNKWRLPSLEFWKHEVQDRPALAASLAKYTRLKPQEDTPLRRYRALAMRITAVQKSLSDGHHTFTRWPGLIIKPGQPGEAVLRCICEAYGVPTQMVNQRLQTRKKQLQAAGKNVN